MFTRESMTRSSELDQGTGSAGSLVSIIIPFLNAERFLRDAVESVIAQSYDNWELLLVDDGSTDSSPAIATICAERYPVRVRILNHDGHCNRGVSASRNLGIRYAMGKYISFLDADDVFLPGKLESQAAVLDSHPKVGAVCGSFQYWYSWTGDASDARRDFVVTPGVEPEKVYEAPFMLLHNLRAGGRKPGTSSIMLRRESVLPEGACEESFSDLGDDHVLWAKLSLGMPIIVMSACVFRYRQHPDSLCSTAIRAGEDMLAWQRYLNWLEEYLVYSGTNSAEIWKALRSCQRSIQYQIRFAWLKLIFRRLLPLRGRYWLRDRWIYLQSLKSRRIAGQLLRSTNQTILTEE
jgi:glycosyltransferase involved in cell wall biosynthesis